MKKWTKILCCVFMFALILTGCATVSNINNVEKEVIFNGNSAVMVGEHLYFGNSFASYDKFTSDGDYKASAKKSYLARLNTANKISVENDFSPVGVENVAEEVAAHGKSFMFVLGQDIYYATPNRQKATNSEGETGNYFNYTTLYRSKLNGDKKTKLYTTNGEVSNIEVLKFEGKYYIVLLAGESLVKIDLSNGKSFELAKGVKSVALPKTYQKNKVGSTLNWNGYIYYTIDRKDEDNESISGTSVYRVLISNAEQEYVVHNQGVSVSFVGRERDVIFYTKGSEIYVSDLTGNNDRNAFVNTQKRFYSASTISGLSVVCASGANVSENNVLGYVFMNNSKLCYSKDGATGNVKFTNEIGTEISSYKVLMITGQTAYLSTTSCIFKADLSSVFKGQNSTVTCTTLVEMEGIYDGAFYAFDGKYIYFFAQLQKIETGSEEESAEADENYYLYRTKVDLNENLVNYQLISLVGNRVVKD